MHVEAICKKCGARYRIEARLAGKTAKCKRCGEMIVIPAASPDDTHTAPVDDLFALKPQEAEPETTYEEKPPLLPPVVADIILPLLISIACFIWIGVMIVPRAIHSASPIIAFILFAFAIGLYCLITLQLTLRAVEGAAKSTDYELPNSVGLQTFAAIAVPTAISVFGYFQGGYTGLLIGLIVGVTLMSLLMALLYGANVSGAVVTGLFASMWYAIGNLAVFAVCGIVAFFLSAGSFKMPWADQYESQTAQALTPAPASQPVVVTTQPAQPAPAPAVAVIPEPPKPAVSAPIAPPKPETPAGPPWVASADPSQIPDAKWPRGLQQIIEVKPGATVVHSDPPSPFVAVVDQDNTVLYDVRGGRRLTLIKEHLQPRSMVVQPGGAYFAAVTMPQVVPGAMPVAQTSNNYQVYAAADGRVVTRFTCPPMVSPTRRPEIWFVGDRLINVAQDEHGAVVVIHELKLVMPPKTIPLTINGETAVSPSGKYLACLTPTKLTVYSLEDGGIAGEAPSRTYSTVRGFAFSPDGSTLAALLDVGAGGWKLVTWDMGIGKIGTDLPVPPLPAATWSSDQFQWLADSRGVLIGDELFDVDTAKVFYTFEHPTAATVGRVMRVSWPDQAIIEFPPATTSSIAKLIYRTSAIPRADIEIALKALRPGTTLPSSAPSEAIAKAPTTTPAATTQHSSMVALIQQKEWTVTVVAVVGVDVDALAAQSQDYQQKVADADRRLAQAKQQVTVASSQYHMEPYTDALGNQRQQKVYNNAAISAASSAARKIEDEERGYKQELARIEREKGTAKSKRTITGKLPDGTVCQVDIDTQAQAVVADTMSAGTAQVITGVARAIDGILHIKPRTMTPAP